MDASSERASAAAIVGAIRNHGHAAWFVGGCVRDELLGIQPHDYDIATSATPQQLLEIFPSSEQVGAHFGVMLVRHGPHAIAVATFRSDQSYSDGRRPDRVVFETGPEQDALRRDFTINALFLDPFNGAILDFTGGRRDLEERLIRAIGDPVVRFREDHLRLIRAIRFAARYHFSIEPETMAAIQQMAPLIRQVAMERVRDELLRILTEGAARRGIELLDEAGLLEHILPEIKKMQGVAQPPQFHPEGDVWTHVMMMLEELGPASPTLALGVLLHDVGKPRTYRVTAERIRFDGHAEVGERMTRGILHRLRCSTDQIDRAAALVANHMRFMDMPRMKQSTLKRFLRMPHFEEHLELHRIDCLASNGNLSNYYHARKALEEMPEEELKPKRLISGRDLIELGMKPGPEFSRILTAIEDAQLEGRIQTREQALAMVESHRNATPTVDAD